MMNSVLSSEALSLYLGESDSSSMAVILRISCSLRLQINFLHYCKKLNGHCKFKCNDSFFPAFLFLKRRGQPRRGRTNFLLLAGCVCVRDIYIYIYEDVQGKLTIKIVRSLLLIYMVSGLSQCEFISHFTTYPSGNY